MKFVPRAFSVAILTCFITPSKSNFLRRDVDGGKDEVAETDPEHRRVSEGKGSHHHVTFRVFIFSLVWKSKWNFTSNCFYWNAVCLQLDWVWVAKDKVYHDDNWYSDYDDGEAQTVENSHVGDPADHLRSSDICPDSSGSSFKHSNCPSTPDCSSISDHEWGSAKLCINRAPLPWDRNTFYVVAMKCIPEWENW